MLRPYRPTTALLLLAALGACGDSDDGIAPERRMLEIGVYDYDVALATSDSTTATLTGSFEITEIHPDSLVGRWSVQGFTGQSQRGYWNVSAYVVPAQPTSMPGTLTHRVWRLGTRTGTGTLGCRASYRHITNTAPPDTFTDTRDCVLANAQ